MWRGEKPRKEFAPYSHSVYRQKLVNEGWNKESIRQYITTHARVHLSRYQRKFMGTGTTVPADVMATLDSNGMVQVPFIRQLNIIVAGEWRKGCVNTPVVPTGLARDRAPAPLERPAETEVSGQLPARRTPLKVLTFSGIVIQLT